MYLTKKGGEQALHLSNIDKEFYHCTAEFEPTQELDKYLLLEGMLNERMNKAIETMNEEVGEEE